MSKALALLLCAGLGAVAQEGSRRGTEMKKTTETGTNVSDPVVDYYDSMSDYFRQGRRAVMLIRDKGMRDTEVAAVLYIARRSSASPNDIIAARKAGKSFEDIARANKVEFAGNDLVREANVVFLSEYHGRSPEEIRSMVGKGATFVDINQEFRRSGAPSSRSTEKGRAAPRRKR